MTHGIVISAGAAALGRLREAHLSSGARQAPENSPFGTPFVDLTHRLPGEADAADGRQVLDRVMGRALTPEQQQTAVASASERARPWAELHGGLNGEGQRALAAE